MVTIICIKSGLSFEAENRRRKIHPEISWYTSHPDPSLRRVASEVIERGRQESWKTLEKFEEEIKKALNPDPDPVPDHVYEFEGAWVARITGYSEQFGYSRDFVNRHQWTNNGRSLYLLNDDGVYETCYTSQKGNKTRKFIKIENGEVFDLSKEELDNWLGDPPSDVVDKDWIDYSFSAPNWNGTDLTHLQVGDHYYDPKADHYYVLETRRYERIDEDGMSFGLADDQGERIYGKARPATPQESLPWRKEQLREAAIAKLKEEYNADRKALENQIRESGDRPEHNSGELLASTVNLYGSGSWFEIEKPDWIWFCQNNGMDGDDWSRNNVTTWGAGAIGWRIPYDRSIAAKIKKIDAILRSDFEVPEQYTQEELEAGARMHQRGGNVDAELVFQAQQAGLISVSEAMNSDF